MSAEISESYAEQISRRPAARSNRLAFPFEFCRVHVDISPLLTASLATS
jgi:hypothetical protein